MKISVKNTTMQFGFLLLLLTVTEQVDVSSQKSSDHGIEDVVRKENSCMKEYQICKPGDLCCEGRNCTLDQCLKPCVQGLYCNYELDCCEGSECFRHYCTRYCKVPGDYCVEYKELCCSGVCKNGTCAGAQCGQIGDTCEPIHNPCCSSDEKDCVNGICSYTCKKLQEKCDPTGMSYLDRCCQNLYCNAFGECEDCLSYGDKCRSQKDCCHDSNEFQPEHCIQGVCRRPCYPNGNFCLRNKDCCSNTCNEYLCADTCSSEDHKCKTSSDCCNPAHVCGEYNLCQRTVNCTKVGTQCSGHNDCCLSFCVEGVCKVPCTLDKNICVSKDECCDGGHCVRGVCQRQPCVEQGLKCKEDDDCCSGSCQKGKCQYTCLPSGKQCKTSDECCIKHCENGSCCFPDNEECRYDEDCCGGYCASGVCKYKCSPQDGACCTGADCCFSDLCIDGKCGKDCSPAGYTCLKPIDCCSGECVNGYCPEVC